MRTTLTLEPDVAVMLRREVRRLGKRPKAIVNDVLRRSLGGERQFPPRPAGKFHTPVIRGGTCLLGDIADISKTMERVEGAFHH